MIRNLQMQSPEHCAISTVSVYELWTGANRCKNPKREWAKIEKLLTTIHVLPFDRQEAHSAADIRAHLEKKGLGIGPYDVLIAAQALVHELLLVTSNEREFSRISHLELSNWRNPITHSSTNA